MPKKNIDLKDPLLLENYYTFTLPNKNELFSYDKSKFCLIEYINMYAELKNIYRSYLATKILTSSFNVKLLLESKAIADSLQQLVDIIIENTKEGLNKMYYANIEHFVVVFKEFLGMDMRAVLGACRKHLVIHRCIELLENPLIHQFLIFIMTLAECDPDNENALAHELVKTGTFKSLCEVISLSRKPPEQDIDLLKELMADNLLLNNPSFQSSPAKKPCTETYALSVFEVLFSLVMVFMDQHNRASQGTLKHSCEKHDVFLEYLFKGDAVLMNALFVVGLGVMVGIYGEAEG
eukprot:TRINITY_DN10184_c0_g1_i2.p1 TRINITY_DN10184_c0_g1~~TRINITY_DN10184_c0_g1_i2.p1  ORF type:complete len:293 (-),score=89.23 TRINITY_DN10184_c0_g1_i2:601-1479(-)